MGKSTKAFVQRLRALNKRADALKAKRQLGTANDNDHAEYAGLKWAINFIEDNPNEALNAIKKNEFSEGELS